MATGKDVFRRNGRELSWASSLAKVENDEFFGFTGIDYEEKLDKALAKGMDRGGPGRGYTRGDYSVEGSVIKGHMSSMLALMEKIASLSADGKSYGEVGFYFCLQFIENDITITEELFGCEIAGRKLSMAQGPDPLIYELPITVEYAKVNGMTLFSNARGRY